MQQGTGKLTQQQAKVQEESEESESESSDDSSDESEKEDNGVPKAKLAGRAPAGKKKSSSGLRAMFK